MKVQKSMTILVGLLAAGVSAWSEGGRILSDSPVLPYSLELERRTQPWCPGECEYAITFVASYRRGEEQLVFVGVRHAFDPDTPTMHAVADGFATIAPAVVVLEGFPTSMGQNPQPLVEMAQRYGAGESDGFERGEAMYAASLALARGIPFLGGEPTQDQRLHELRAEGFTDADLAFDAVMGWYSQSLRSNEVPDNSLASLSAVYPQLVDTVKQQTGLDAPTVEEFRRRYKGLYGVDIVEDPRFPLRTDVFDTTEHGRLNVAAMMIRDRHILGVIEKQLGERRRVLVVYGGAHWSTLSAALEARLGKPEIKPFAN